jgi:uncharacterized protein (DUF3084 family)
VERAPPADFHQHICSRAKRGAQLAKPNYQFEKRRRDLDKKKKQDEKRQRKLEKKNAARQETPTPLSEDDKPPTQGD